MKKYILAIAISISLAVAACGGNASDNKKSENQDTTTQTPASSASKNPDYQKGLDLVAKNDCLTCHQVAATNTGPAYQDVANKYTGADSAVVNSLAQKIISGGSGVWGTVPMTPHADLSVDDAKAMVKYILLLKTK